MKKKTITYCNTLATQRGGKCLSIEYFNNKTKMLWKCNNTHQWGASLNSIHQGSWCPYCSKNNKYSIDDCTKTANNKGGICLSREYINNRTKMLWKCNVGHIWANTYNMILNDGNWCPYCVRTAKLSIKKAYSIADEKSGKCLSTEYFNNKTKMKWECKKRHLWYATLNHIKNHNRWCPECAQLKRAKSQNNSYILYHWKTKEKLICVASYEKKVVEYLNANKINFMWQPRYFKMPDGKKYYPDMYLYTTKKWVEIKGYFREDALEKWNWFQSIKHNSDLWDRGKLKEMGII